MKENDFEAYTRFYDQIYVSGKDYRKEAEAITSVVNQFEKKRSKTLLDVACGTGEHLKYLSSRFKCTGLDISERMIKIARNKVPSVNFKVANMINFSLREKFDVITCLFSSIGYVQNFRNLAKTLENFHKHLNKDGLTIVEPWIFKKDFQKEYVQLITREDRSLKLVRMATSKLEKSKWLLFMHYLIGEKDEINYIKEVHNMIAADYPDYIKAFKFAAFKDTRFLTENLWDGCRGLFVASKQN